MYYYQPGGSSVKNLIHWLQILGSEEIRQFDYGTNTNLKIYGTSKPPVYEFDKLRKMKIDIFITSTSRDPYCLKSDIETMLQTFQSAKVYSKDVGNYNHLDYIWSKKAVEDIYFDFLKFLNDI
jgi:lysosomal acid lipase/cholesteryl ester hydrolase